MIIFLFVLKIKIKIGKKEDVKKRNFYYFFYYFFNYYKEYFKIHKKKIIFIHSKIEKME